MRKTYGRPFATAGARACFMGALVLVCLLSIAPALRAGEREAFIGQHLCDVAGRLASIEQGYREGKPNPFLILSIVERGQSYVQCLFVDPQGGLFCEASSGLLGPPEGAEGHMRLGAEALAALTVLGFETDEAEGNYWRLVERGEGGHRHLAEVMLDVLHRVYGARTDLAIEIKAPLAPGPPADACGTIG
jgi:hypothetical protein